MAETQSTALVRLLRAPAQLTALATGAGAAGAGIGLVALPLFLLWLVTPYADGGLGDVLHLAACLWLLAHGGPLGRGTAPLGVAPLLVTVAVLVLLWRAARRAGQDSPRPASTAWAVGLGYLTVGACAALTAATGTLQPRLFADLAWLLLVVPPTVVLGVRAGTETDWHPLADAARLVRAWGRYLGIWPVRDEPQQLDEPEEVTGTGAEGDGRWGVRFRALWAGWPAAEGARAGLAGASALLGAGALVLVVGLVLSGTAPGREAAQLAPDLPGRLALLLTCLVLVPNAAVWGAAYALGPGFSLGAGAQVYAWSAGQLPPLALPLLAAAPAPGRSVVDCAALALALAPGLTAGWFLRGTTGLRHAVRATLTAALVAGACSALAALLAGGALGAEALSHVGPDPLLTGSAAAAWTFCAGLPAALLLRWSRSRRGREVHALLGGPGTPAPEPLVTREGTASTPGRAALGLASLKGLITRR